MSTNYRFSGDPYSLPLPSGPDTAPITEWLEQATGRPMTDVLMPDGHTIRALTVEAAIVYLNQGGVSLPRMGWRH